MDLGYTEFGQARGCGRDETVKFNVYGRFQVEVERDHDRWVAYRVSLGKRSALQELAIPGDLSREEIPTYLDAFFHELAGPGQSVVEV
jgi:hypothetical protein